MSQRCLQVVLCSVLIALLGACTSTPSHITVTATRSAPTEALAEPTRRLTAKVAAATPAATVAGKRTPAPLSSPTPTASGWLYRDANGYFAAWAPAGWKQEDFPGETVRSKVAFHHPKDDQIVIRLIVGPVSAGYSYKKMYAETQAKAPALQKQLGTGASVQVSERQIDDRKAVIMRASAARGALEQEIVLLLNEQATIAYSLAYSTSSRKTFEEYEPLFRTFVEQFQILESGKSFTEEELIQAAVSKKLRLAELNAQLGQYGLARQYVQEGLALDPDNAELLKMEQSLQGK